MADIQFCHKRCGHIVFLKVGGLTKYHTNEMNWNETWAFIWTSGEGDGALSVGISVCLTCLLILSESGERGFITYFLRLWGWTEKISQMFRWPKKSISSSVSMLKVQPALHIGAASLTSPGSVPCMHTPDHRTRSSRVYVNVISSVCRLNTYTVLSLHFEKLTPADKISVLLICRSWDSS